MESAPRPDMASAIENLARASVLVVGDAMLDRYVFGAVHRISPEAPVPVLSVQRELALPGGAGNVVRNLTALGAAAALVSVVGDDQAGSDLTGLIGGQPNVEPWLLVQGSRCTTVKTRFVADGQQLLRSDQEVTSPIHTKLAERLLRIAGDVVAATSITILSDYAKGVLAGDTPSRIIAAAKAAGRRVVADPRGADLSRFAGADVAVLTLRSLAAASDMAVDGPARMQAAARWLRKVHGFGAVIVNRRADGFYVTAQNSEHDIQAAARDLYNFTGAGDTAVAAIASSLATGADLEMAVRIAALAMAVCATQPGMAVAPAADLLAVLTPQGRARRKIVSPDAAIDQLAHWRRSKFRIGVLAMLEAPLPMEALTALRQQCDRVVLCLQGASEAAVTLAEDAALSAIDLICVAGPGELPALVAQLQPDIVLPLNGDPADAESRGASRLPSLLDDGARAP